MHESQSSVLPPTGDDARASPYLHRMQRTDILILGGGLIGLTTALALDRHGISSVVVDPADPAATLSESFDGRASAVASASWRMLEAIGIADALRPRGCPIRCIEVRDGLQRGALDFTPGDGEALGTMVENQVLRRTLYDAALAAEHIALNMKTRATVERSASGVTAVLSDGQQVRADLLLVAEGRRSPTRDAAGIRIARWQYDHTAIVTVLDHSLPHDNVAHEIFYPAGPFALLPMLAGPEAPGRSALVWTVDARDGAGVMALSPHAFAHEVAKRAGGLLGDLTLAAPRASWPLGFHHAARITDMRLALIGDAAHGVHPIAGQGLNLGFRDVAAFVEVVVDGARTGLDCGDAQLLARYQRWRSLDTLMVATATDTLTRLFGIPGPAARAVRRFGLGAVQRITPLKDLFMAEARGENGQLPKLLEGALV